MDLNRLLSSIEILEQKNTDLLTEEECTGICYHSGKAKPGNLFVAMTGFLTDGHNYISSAQDNGCIAAVVERFVDDAIPQFRVKDARKALAELSAASHDQPSDAMHMVGITATNGKTTTAYMLHHIYEEAKWKTGMVGTVMVKIGEQSIPSELTTPESLDLQQYLAQMRDVGTQVVVMEASSSALDLSRVHNVNYDIVTFNNFAQEHLAQHGTLENYLAAKSKLITQAKAGAYAVLNMDYPEIAQLAGQTKATVLTYSLQGNGYDFGIRDVDLSTGRAGFTFEIQRDIKLHSGSVLAAGSFPIQLGTAGYSSVMNSVVAIICALIDEIPVSVIQKALLEFRGVERRFEIIFEDEFLILDDHFANTANIDVTLNTLTQMQYNKLHMLYAIRGNRGVTMNRENAENIIQWNDKLKLDHIYATKSMDSVGPKDTVSADEEAVFLEIMKNNNIAVTLSDDLADGIAQVLQQAKKGDVVLLAGCQGMDKAARIALPLLHEQYPQIDEEILYRPLKHRIC